MSLRPRAAAAPKGAPARRGTLHGPAITLAPRAAPVGVYVVAPWLNAREAKISKETRNKHGQKGEFYWQVRNMLTKWQNTGPHGLVALVMQVNRVLTHWYQVEKYNYEDPMKLAILMIVNMLSLKGEFGITEALVQEAMDAALGWGQSLVHKMTPGEQALYSQRLFERAASNGNEEARMLLRMTAQEREEYSKQKLQKLDNSDFPFAPPSEISDGEMERMSI